jgi:F-type H+-transporting ATPase subunit epsilon
MHLDIVTPDRKVVVGESTDVVVPALEGEMEVLPGHAPVLSLLGTGILSFVHAGKTTRLMVSGGFVEVDGDNVTLMCEAAALASDVVAASENKALYEAEQKLKALGPVSATDEKFLLHKAEVERAAAKLTLVK